MTVRDIEILDADTKQQDASRRLRKACLDLDAAGLWNTPEANAYVDRLFAESHDALDAYHSLMKSDPK